MKNKFSVTVEKFEVLSEIAGFRKTSDYVALLDAMDFGEVGGSSELEIKDMCVMALQDHKPEEAASIVLKHDLGQSLTDGQIKNCSNEMLREKLWEEYADMGLHERFFNSASLLSFAFPADFPTPDAVRVSLEIIALNDRAKTLLQSSVVESFLVRILADGIDRKSSALHRLFDEQLASDSFPEADKIIWQFKCDHSSPEIAKVQITSSGFWLDQLRDTASFESSAYADET